MPLLCQKNQGLGDHCIKLSGLRPWSLVIGLWCHIMWGQTIWVRGGSLAEPPGQSRHKLSWTVIGQKYLNLDNGSSWVSEWVTGLRIIVELKCGYRLCSFRRSQGAVSGGSWKQVEVLGGQVLSIQSQKSLIWKSGRLPCAPAWSTTIQDPSQCTARSLYREVFKLLRDLSWKHQPDGHVRSSPTPQASSILHARALSPLPFTPCLVPSKFHLTLPRNPVAESA